MNLHDWLIIRIFEKNISNTPHIMPHILTALALAGALSAPAADSLVLHYDRPARFFEEALVIGMAISEPWSMVLPMANACRSTT